MKLQILTLTGADESVSPANLHLPQETVPVEWGILICPTIQGTSPRFPSVNWMRLLPDNLNIAFHLCGKASKDVLKGNFSFASEHPELLAKAKRIQINFTQGRAKTNVQGLAEVIRSHPQLEFIIQLHGPNREVLDDLLAMGITPHCLFDASGGRGIETKIWPEPIVGPAFTGFAGGLSPALLASQLPAIAAAAGEFPFGIDMETSLRFPDNRQFCLDACRQAQMAVERFVAEQTPAS